MGTSGAGPRPGGCGPCPSLLHCSFCPKPGGGVGAGVCVGAVDDASLASRYSRGSRRRSDVYRTHPVSQVTPRTFKSWSLHCISGLCWLSRACIGGTQPALGAEQANPEKVTRLLMVGCGEKVAYPAAGTLPRMGCRHNLIPRLSRGFNCLPRKPALNLKPDEPLSRNKSEYAETKYLQQDF